MKRNKVSMQNHMFGELERREGCNHESLENVSRPLQIVVPYTTPDLSRAALNAAATLAGDMQATVVLLAVQVVPYPLPLDQPPVQTTFFLRQLTTMARENPLQVRIELVLARSRSEALRKFIAPGTLVLLVTKKRWWRTSEETLARILAEQGCSVSLLTLHGEKRDIPLFGLTPGEEQERNGKVGRSLFHHIIRL